jgi:hypothetical protein
MSGFQRQYRIQPDAKTVGRAPSQSRRSASASWQLLAWSLIMSGAFDRAAIADDGAAPVNVADIELVSSLSSNDSQLTGLAEAADLVLNAEDTLVSSQLDGPEHVAVTFDAIEPNQPTTHSLGAGTLDVAPHAGSIVSAALPYSSTQPVQIYPDLAFFSGLDAYSKSLGFDAGVKQLLGTLDASLGNSVEIAAGFAKNPLASLGIWRGLDSDPVPSAFWKGDTFDVDWVVQATGQSGVGKPVIADIAGVQGSVTSQLGAAIDPTDASKTIGNTGVLVDGGDWQGTLWVTKNYFEFNTIVQVNLLWDNDTVSLVNTSPTASLANGTVSTGQNVQTNKATILDADVVNTDPAVAGTPVDHSADGAPSQLILGGVYENFSAIQFNNIVDMDQISFIVADYFKLAADQGPGLQTIGFADVNSSGHTQANQSVMVGGGTASGPDLTAGQFFQIKSSAGPVQVVDGNYYEFNTIFQINVTFDTNSYFGTAGAAVTTGGSVQFNQAAILGNDSKDDLFVGGTYTQYNLVLQVNALQDSDLITQLSAVHHEVDAATTGLIGAPPIVSTAPDGTSGTGPTINLTLQSAIDDMSTRLDGMI